MRLSKNTVRHMGVAVRHACGSLASVWRHGLERLMRLRMGCTLVWAPAALPFVGSWQFMTVRAALHWMRRHLLCDLHLSACKAVS